MSVEDNQVSINQLLDIMQALRDPSKGCSWDQAQTFATIAQYTIEEAYEVVDAITRSNMDDLCDELGDLLLQVVYHSQMAKEQNHFSFKDVVSAICAKMIRRHPHVFGSEEQIATGKQDWEQFKSQERTAKGNIEEDGSVITHVAEGLPPLVRARKLQKRAAKVNFDWPNPQSVFAKIQEEILELEEAMSLKERNSQVEEEIGDLLFSVINLCRHVQVDADIALQKANSKFEYRFRMMEKFAVEEGLSIADMSDKESDLLWDRVKKQLRE